MSRKPVVAIDGPAGAGKSTVAKRLAQVLPEGFARPTVFRGVVWSVQLLERLWSDNWLSRLLRVCAHRRRGYGS